MPAQETMLASDATGTAPFQHQISGHGALVKLPGGKIGKPLIEREEWFYSTLDKHSPLVPFTAKYHGVTDLEFSEETLEEWKRQITAAKESSDAGKASINPWSIKVTSASLDKMLQTKTQPYLCLEDLTYPFRIPCICDVKIGTRQHGDDAAPDKKLRHTAKCENTTSKPLGVRLCGQMVYEPDGKRYRYFDKYEGRKVTVNTIQSKLGQYFSNGRGFRKDVLLKFIERLKQLIEAVEDEDHRYRFYSTSLLFIYEGHIEEGDTDVLCDMRMIDFAHTFPYCEGDPKDDGYLFGLRNLLQLFKQIAAEHP